jgi:translocation and assembly module TamB
MKRAAKIAIAAAGVVIGLQLLLAATLGIAANTQASRQAIEQIVPKLTDGMVTIRGLSGRFPDALRIGHIAVSDKEGRWLTIDNARLDWSPLSLLHGELQIGTLSAAHVVVARLPERSTTSSGTYLPLRVVVDDVQIDRLDLEPPVAGGAAALSVKGSLRLASSEQGAVTLDVERFDRAGSYKLRATLTPGAITGRVYVSEPSHALLSGLAHLPNLGPLSLAASLSGPRNAEHARFSLSAGPLRAQAQGTIDLRDKTMSVDLVATAPAMTPRPNLSWQSARVEAHLHGPFAGPDVTGHLDLENLQAGSVAVQRFTADAQGNSGAADLTAVLAGLRLPGRPADLFASAPFVLRAHATLNAPARPVTFNLSHPLISASGEVNTAGTLAGSVTVALPSLAPYAAIASVDIRGHTGVTATFARRGGATSVKVAGTVGVTGGQPAVVALVGDKATLALTGTLQGTNHAAIDHFAFNGKAMRVSAHGGWTNRIYDMDWNLALLDLSRLAPTIAGTLSATGRIHGPPKDLAVSARATGEVATARLPKEPLTLSLEARGLPASPSGKLEVQGRLAGAPLALVATMKRQDDGTFDFVLDRLHWKSASGYGKLTLTRGAIIPLGQMQFHIARLADLTPLTGVAIAGRVDATLDTVQAQGKPQVRIRADMRRLALDGETVDQVTLDGRVADPVTRPRLALTVKVDRFRRGALTGNARLTANGGAQSVALRLAANLQTTQGLAKLSAAATAGLRQRDLRLTSLRGDYDRETVHLLAPARIAFANGVSVDNLRLGMGKAVFALTGRFAPPLALTVSARDITPVLAAPFVPGLGGSGTIALDGQLRGSLAAPEGTLRLTARRLQVTTHNVGGLPPANIDATATLVRDIARVDARLTAGPDGHLRLTGTAPLRRTAPVHLRLTGATDLAMLDPLLTPNGQAAHGQVTLDVGVSGTMAQPHATGTIRLAHASVQDFVRGIHVTDVTGRIEANGDTLRIVQLDGHAGPGTLAVAGTIGILRPELPISLTVTAHHARLPASNLLNAILNANVTLRGQLRGSLNIAGKIHVDHANINIPDRFPPSVAVLHVRRPGAKPPPRPAPTRPMTFALSIDAPEQVFVRGHGIDAEMGGRLNIAGNSKTPAISGGFDLRHGTFSLGGQTLTFTKGRIAFDGSGLTNRLDPTIDFVAENTSNGVTATLTVTGYADAPKIQLSSSPELPQDEILAHLLFGRSVKQLSPVQLAEIAGAVAEIGGIGGENPLAAVRKGLGLDRLTVGSASGGGAAVEAGKYIANGVYLGTKQGTSGGTQAQVQIDLAKHLKLESTVGTGGTPATGATPNNDPGTSVGLTYQFEY